SSGDPPPPKSTPLSLFPLSPFLSPKHLDTICFCQFICFFLYNCGLDFLWSGDQFSSNCEEVPLERWCGARELRL
ncbi:uncharacterized protein N7479_006841, partial [Penicillium vulpinum]|uniref:uncharacterized protein n=1 Tax=Penicillium vulpinum TaxID=29845 RepID=UPI0025490394